MRHERDKYALAGLGCDRDSAQYERGEVAHYDVTQAPSEYARALVADRPALLTMLVERALAGDIGAAQLLLERTVAPLKASEEAAMLTLPGGTLTEQGRAVVATVASGELAPGQGAALLASLGTLAKLTEADELERRIVALEGTRP